MSPHTGVAAADTAGTGQAAQFAADSSPAVRAETERAAAPSVVVARKAPDPGILQAALHMLESLGAAADLRGISSRLIPSNNTCHLKEVLESKAHGMHLVLDGTRAMLIHVVSWSVVLVSWSIIRHVLHLRSMPFVGLASKITTS